MTFAIVHEIADPFDCYVRGLGWGNARFIVIGSINANPQFIVRLEDGRLRTIDQNDLAVAGNPSAGQSLIPETAKDWHDK